MRNAVNQASTAADTAKNTGANLGGAATGISGNLVPFETSMLENPQGYSQQDQSAMLSAGLAGAGGAASGITGLANKEAATSRNAGGFQAALADAARSRDKAAAGASEDIAAKNADVKQVQQQNAATKLGDLYKTDTSGMLDAMGQIPSNVDASVAANNSGWLQNTNQILRTLTGQGKQ